MKHEHVKCSNYKKEALRRFTFLLHCHLHPLTCGFLFVKIGFYEMLVFPTVSSLQSAIQWQQIYFQADEPSKNIKKLSSGYFMVKLSSFTLQGSESKQHLEFASSCLNFVHWEV